MSPEVPLDDARESSTPATQTEGQVSRGGIVRRLMGWANQHRLITLLMFALTSVGVALGWYLVLGRHGPGANLSIAHALQALDEGRLSEARDIATLLRNSPKTAPEQLGGPAFVLGAAAALQADQTRDPERKNLFLVASRHLEEARDRGFPAGREAEGLLLLGQSLYRSGQIPASRPVLRDALAASTKRHAEIHYLLAEAYLNDTKPDYNAALQENSLCLAERELSAAQRHQGLLQRAKLLLALNRIPQCKETLSKIPADTKDQAEVAILHGQMLLREASDLAPTDHSAPAGADAAQTAKYRQKLEAAIAEFRRAESHDTLSTQVGGKATYLIGLTLTKLKDYRAALNQFARLSKVRRDTPEAIAATLQEAELARRLGKHSDAMKRYRQVLEHVGSPETFSNPWISWEDLQKQIMAAYQQYLDAENFPIASQLADQLYPLFPRKQQREIAARTYRNWGESLLAQAKALLPSKAEAMAQRGREQLRRAGWQFQQAAQLRLADREYPDDLWESAACYLEGHDFGNAVDLFQQYLKNESRRRRAQGLVSLAEALLASDRLDEALAACLECTDLHPRDPAAVRARLLAARTLVAKNEPEKAKKLLQDNLNGESLTPASMEWQESLFDLGCLLYRQGKYEEAADRLHEAVQRYPGSPRSLMAQYLMAASYERHARQLEEKLKVDRVENTRTARRQQIRQLLTSALTEYRQLQEKLARRQETDELRPLEQLTLRNCCFATGHVLFLLQQYEDAIKAYILATNRYQNNPEVLDAYVEIARAYRKLNKPAEARGALEQAKMVLARLKPDVSFQETTNYTRQQWAQLLENFTAS